MEEVKNMKSMKTPEEEYFSQLILTQKIWIQIKQMCFVLQLINYNFYARGKDPIFNKQCHSCALESKDQMKTTRKSY